MFVVGRVVLVVGRVVLVVGGTVLGVEMAGSWAAEVWALTVTATGMATTLHITVTNTTAVMLRHKDMLAFVLAAAMLPRFSSSLA